MNNNIQQEESYSLAEKTYSPKMRFISFLAHIFTFFASAIPHSVTLGVNFGNVSSSNLSKVACNFCQVVAFRQTITQCPGPYLFVGGRRNEKDFFWRGTFNMISAGSNYTSLETLGKFPPDCGGGVDKICYDGASDWKKWIYNCPASMPHLKTDSVDVSRTAEMSGISRRISEYSATQNSSAPTSFPTNSPKNAGTMWYTVVIPIAIVFVCLAFCVKCFSGKETDGAYMEINQNDNSYRDQGTPRDNRVYVSDI